MRKLFLIGLVILVTVVFVRAQDDKTVEPKHGLQTWNPLSDKWEQLPIPEDAQLFTIDVNGDAQPAVLFGTTSDKKQVLLVPVNEYEQFLRSWQEQKDKDVKPVTPGEKTTEK